jgi:glutaconate CoA-transferase, subunit A
VSKLATLERVIASIPDGSTVALDGRALHRVACAAVHELVRQGRRGLTVVKTSAGYEVDLLAGNGCLERVVVSYVGFEALGMAPMFRRAIESGAASIEEHTCYTVIAGLRAAAFGVPFLPVADLGASVVVARGRLKKTRDPYGGPAVLTVPAIRPDVAIIHVNEADEDGNGRIYGNRYESALMAGAAPRVVLTSEQVVPRERLAERPELTAVPGFLVEAVVAAPGGAWPTSLASGYTLDRDYLRAYLAAASGSASDYRRFMEERVLAPAGIV